MTWERLGPRDYVPMRIVARMDEPIAYLGDLLHIDGPIAYGAFHDLDERTRRTIAPVGSAEYEDWPIDLTLPLSTWWCEAAPDANPRLLKRSRRGKDGPPPRLWGWCASAADETAWAGRGVLEVRKRPELGKMSRYTSDRSANISSGHMKAYDLKIPTVLAREVVWYAHGDPDRVRHLLSTYVPAIGKKRSTGNGTVREWIVEQIDEDRSVVAPDGQLMRRMPRGAVDGSPGHGGIRPPYYHHTRQVESVEPWA